MTGGDEAPAQLNVCFLDPVLQRLEPDKVPGPPRMGNVWSGKLPETVAHHEPSPSRPQPTYLLTYLLTYLHTYLPNLHTYLVSRLAALSSTLL